MNEYFDNGVKLGGNISPTSPLDTYGTHVDVLGIGGYMAFENLSERDSLPMERRKEGLLCNVADQGDKGVMYKLTGGIMNAHWEELESGGVTEDWVIQNNVQYLQPFALEGGRTTILAEITERIRALGMSPNNPSVKYRTTATVFNGSTDKPPVWGGTLQGMILSIEVPFTNHAIVHCDLIYSDIPARRFTRSINNATSGTAAWNGLWQEETVVNNTTITLGDSWLGGYTLTEHFLNTTLRPYINTSGTAVRPGCYTGVVGFSSGNVWNPAPNIEQYYGFNFYVFSGNRAVINMFGRNNAIAFRRNFNIAVANGNVTVTEDGGYEDLIPVPVIPTPPVMTSLTITSWSITDFVATTSSDLWNYNALRKYDKTVQIMFTFKNTSGLSLWDQYTNIATLPSGYRPAMETIVPIFVQPPNVTNAAYNFAVRITTGGSISLIRRSAAGITNIPQNTVFLLSATILVP